MVPYLPPRSLILSRMDGTYSKAYADIALPCTLFDQRKPKAPQWFVIIQDGSNKKNNQYDDMPN